MTEQGAGAVRCNDLFDDAAASNRSKLELIHLNTAFCLIEAPHVEPERTCAQTRRVEQDKVVNEKNCSGIRYVFERTHSASMNCALWFLRAALSNAGVQRRRTAPNEGVPLASLSPAQNILTDFTFPV